MRLSCGDDNAMFSVRPDHQWTGASSRLAPTLRYRALSHRRGGPGFQLAQRVGEDRQPRPVRAGGLAESVVATEAGGRKAPPDLPWITDWTCSSNGARVNCISNRSSVCDRDLTERSPPLRSSAPLDPSATLENLMYQKKRYRVTQKGITPMD